MKHRGPHGILALPLAVMILSAMPSGAGASPLTRELDKAGRSLCQSLQLKCHKSTAKHGKKAKARVTKPSAKRLRKQNKKPVAPVKPDAAPVTAKSIVPIPRSKPPLPSAPAPTIIAPPQDGPVADCLADLSNSGVEFVSVPAPAGAGNCHVDLPVRLHGVLTASGNVALPDKPILNCRFARELALWLSEAKLAKVWTGPGYECRGRNGDASAKLSEHAYGNAVDITTIATLDGRTIQIADAINPASPAFGVLRGLRTSACGHFSTVLGPGANAAHAAHFHFDMAVRGKSGTYRICQ